MMISMKTKFFFVLSFLFVGLQLMATRQIIIHQGGQTPTHFEFPVPAVEPDVYYDSDAQLIIIEGTGNVSYYDVEITALSTFDVPISTRIDGTYDTIDISSLPSDDYVITINTPVGSSCQCRFTII